MPVSSGARKRAKSFLNPDDELQYVFPADIVHSVSPSVLIVVSRKAITVLSTGFWSRKSPKSVVATMARSTRIGPVHTTAGIPCFTLSGILYEIDDEYVAVVNAADAEGS